MTTVTFLGGVQLISVGILGEHIARMYDENKDRPLESDVSPAPSGIKKAY